MQSCICGVWRKLNRARHCGKNLGGAEIVEGKASAEIWRKVLPIPE